MVGTLLYYTFALDNIMLVYIGDLVVVQNKNIQKTVEALTELLKYVATFPNAKIRYQKSYMILYTHSNSSYLSAPKARIRAGCFNFF